MSSSCIYGGDGYFIVYSLRFSRILGVVSLGGRNINVEMLEAGVAEVFHGDPAPGQDLARYWKVEEKAKAAKRGMWT